MALSSLEGLLAKNRIDPNEVITQKMYVERLDTEIEVSFRRLSYAKYKYFKRAAITSKRGGAESFDIDKYRTALVLDCLVDPDFTKTEFLSSFGAPNGEVGISMVFLTGEIISLAEAILKESGFSEDPFRDDLPEDEGNVEE